MYTSRQNHRRNDNPYRKARRVVPTNGRPFPRDPPPASPESSPATDSRGLAPKSHSPARIKGIKQRKLNRIYEKIYKLDRGKVQTKEKSDKRAKYGGYSQRRHYSQNHTQGNTEGKLLRRYARFQKRQQFLLGILHRKHPCTL